MGFNCLQIIKINGSTSCLGLNICSVSGNYKYCTGFNHVYLLLNVSERPGKRENANRWQPSHHNTFLALYNNNKNNDNQHNYFKKSEELAVFDVV